MYWKRSTSYQLDQTKSNTDVLNFLRDHYTVAQGQVDRQEFANFVRRSLNTYPGIQALEWAPLMQQIERTEYEQNIQAEGYNFFQITELSSSNHLTRANDRSYYIPVTYIAPLQNNEAALGGSCCEHTVQRNHNAVSRAFAHWKFNVVFTQLAQRIRTDEKSESLEIAVFLNGITRTSYPVKHNLAIG